MPLIRMRTLEECYEEIKKLDPNTCITKYFIRQLALNNKIPVIMAGRKRLINFDALLEYLENPHQEKEIKNGIRQLY